MPSGRSVEAGRGFFRLFYDDERVRKGLVKTERQLQSAARGFASFGLAVGAAGGSIVAPLTLAVKSAADANETFNKLTQVFKEETAAAEEFSLVLSEEVGRSLIEVQNGLATFGSLFAGLGFNREQAREMSEQLTRLAADFSSFQNITQEEALQRFTSALTGSVEVLDRFGINLKEGALLAELHRQGIEGTIRSATEQQKTFARVNIIMRAMTEQGAVGDAIRTQSEFANVVRRLNAEILDMRVAIGRQLIPILAPMILDFAKAVQAVAAWAEENKDLIIIVSEFGLVLAAMGAAAGTVAAVLFGLAKAAGAARAAMLLFNASLGGQVSVIITLAAAVLALSEAHGALANRVSETSTRAQDFLDKMDKTRDSQRRLLETLHALGSQQSLTNEQQKEAAGIIEELEKLYGDLGLRVDEETGQILGLADAFNNLAEAQKAQQRIDVARALEEQRENIKKLREELERASGFFTALNDIFSVTQDPEGAQRDKVNAILEKLLEAQDEASALQSRLTKLGEGTSGEGVDITPEDEVDNTQLEAELQRERIRLLRSGLREELELLDLRRREAVEAAEKEGQDVNLVHRRFALEKVRISREAAEKIAEEERKLAETTQKTLEGFQERFAVAQARLNLDGDELEKRLLEIRQTAELRDLAEDAGLRKELERLQELEREVLEKRLGDRSEGTFQEQSRLQRNTGVFASALAGRALVGDSINQDMLRVNKDQLDELRRVRELAERGGGIQGV